LANFKFLPNVDLLSPGFLLTGNKMQLAIQLTLVSTFHLLYSFSHETAEASKAILNIYCSISFSLMSVSKQTAQYINVTLN